MYGGKMEATKVSATKVSAAWEAGVDYDVFRQDRWIRVEITGDKGSLSSLKFVVPERVATVIAGTLMAAATGQSDQVQAVI
jgi:hypothetical protein